MTAPTPADAPGAGDAERDAWLHQALRHAPDAALVAPAALTDAILREARSAVGSSVASRSPRAATHSAVGAAQRARASRARGLVHRLADVWDALARPAVAAGLASLIAATLVGMLWWDRPLEDPASGAGAAADVTRAVPAARDPAPPATTAPTGRNAIPPRSAERASADAERAAPAAAPALPTQRPGKAPRSHPLQGEAKALSGREPEDAAQRPRRSVPAPSGDRLDAEAPGARSRSTPHITESRSETGTPQPFPAVPAPGATARADAPPRLETQNPAAALAPPAGGEGPRTVPGAAATASADVAPSPLGALRSALAAEPDAWSWARAGAHEQPLDAAMLDWLARLDAASNAPWAGVRGSPNSRLRDALPAASAAPADAADRASVLVFRDGRLAATLRFGAGTVELAIGSAAGVAVGPRQWRAPLAPDRARALQADLP
jgi:hypothetical protein